jgi:hypothetical protein
VWSSAAHCDTHHPEVALVKSRRLKLGGGGVGSQDAEVHAATLRRDLDDAHATNESLRAEVAQLTGSDGTSEGQLQLFQLLQAERARAAAAEGEAAALRTQRDALHSSVATAQVAQPPSLLRRVSAWRGWPSAGATVERERAVGSHARWRGPCVQTNHPRCDQVPCWARQVLM